MERSARFVVVPLLRHSGLVTAEFSENREQLFVTVEPIDTYAVVGVGVFREYGTAAFPSVWWWDVQKAAKAG
jgi:hypothetical protein